MIGAPPRRAAKLETRDNFAIHRDFIFFENEELKGTNSIPIFFENENWELNWRPAAASGKLDKQHSHRGGAQTQFKEMGGEMHFCRSWRRAAKK